MRKPVVVVCVAATALLLAGGVAATTAGAEETPDRGGWSGWALPSLPGFGDFDGLGDWGFHGADDNVDAGDWDADDLDAGNADSNPADSGAPDAGDKKSGDKNSGDKNSGGSSSAGPNSAGPNSAGPNSAGSNSADSDYRADDVDPGSGDDAAGAGRLVPQRPAKSKAAQDELASRSRALRRPAADQQRPARKQQDNASARRRPAQRQPGIAARPGAASIAAARRSVTASDVSASPYSPVQQRVLALVNQNRRRGGCGELSIDRRLVEAANEHASDMARRQFFAHDSPNGDRAGDRVRGAGYRWTRYGENIARGADSPYEVVNGWMNSPPHRRNIMDCRLHQMGIGLAIGRNRTPYWVQDFASRQQ